MPDGKQDKSCIILIILIYLSFEILSIWTGIKEETCYYRAESLV